MKAWKLLAIVLMLLASGFGEARGQTLTTLWSFSSTANPFTGLVQGSDGIFYGTTKNGGTVFKITPQGTLTTLSHVGGSIQSVLVQGIDSNFYGTTFTGGNGYGSIFKMTSRGTVTTLYQFAGNSTNGSEPFAGLVQGSDGNFYGTTTFGGTNVLSKCNGFKSYGGTVFRVTPQGTLTTLWQFSDTDVNEPEAALVQGIDGNFYGTTYIGGTNSGGCGGTVFKITSEGTLTTLYEFGGVATDGIQPQAGLVQGSDGNFYGTTYRGGTNNAGTIFKITPQGALTTLWQFSGSDGSTPQAALVQGSDGNFYGTASYGGNSSPSFPLGYGTIFETSPTGGLTTLYFFSPSDGFNPIGGLVQGIDGDFYGTTYYGAVTNLDSGRGVGTVFKIPVPLNPPANQISSVASDSSGTNLVFSIPSVAYETYQLQFTTDLTSDLWSNVPGVSVTNSIGAMLTLTNIGGAVGPQGFYRFAITP